MTRSQNNSTRMWNSERQKQRTKGFASRLDSLIAERGGNISDFAREIGRAEGTVRKWLRALSEPNVTDLRMICRLTGADSNWLIGMQRGVTKPADSKLESRTAAVGNAVQRVEVP